MLFKSMIDPLVFSNGSTVAYNATGTLSARIKQEPMRLEAILLMATFPTTASNASPTNTVDGAAGMLKAIRLKVNDKLGNRSAVDVHPPGLLSLNRNNFETLGRYTRDSYGCIQPASATTTYRAMYYIPLRHPTLADPFGNYTSLPLNSGQIKEDPVLEVDVRAVSEVFNAGAPTSGNTTLAAYAVLREVPVDWPYIPSELRSDFFIPGSTGKKQFEFPSSGWLTQALIQPYSAATIINSTTRGDSVTAGSYITLDYGRTVLRKGETYVLQELNDMSQDSSYYQEVNTGASKRQFAGEILFDLLTDYPGQDPWSVGSLLNLSTDALGGDKCRITWENYQNGTTPLSVITHHRLLGTAQEMAALRAGI